MSNANPLLYGVSAAAILASLGSPVEPSLQVVPTYRGRVTQNSGSGADLVAGPFTVGEPAPNKYIVVWSIFVTGITAGEENKIANCSIGSVDGITIRNAYYVDGNHRRRWQVFIFPHQEGSDTEVTVTTSYSDFVSSRQTIVYTIENADPTPYDFISRGAAYTNLGVQDIRNPEKACFIMTGIVRNNTSTSDGRFFTAAAELPIAGIDLDLTIDHDDPITTINSVGELSINSQWAVPSLYNTYNANNTTVQGFVFGPPRNKKVFFRPGTNYYIPRSGVTQGHAHGIGGGGGGGSRSGGGGGGAGSYMIKKQIDITPLTSIQLIVGDGGLGGSDAAAEAGTNGGSTSYAGEVLGRGGGGGGTSLASSTTPNRVRGSNGGSGGGAGRYEGGTGLQPGSPTLGQGTRGGYGDISVAGGGGGAGDAGSDATSTAAGNGGIGIDLSEIFGTEWGEDGWFCGGGGGGVLVGSSRTSGAGGQGGGGAGGGTAGSTAVGAGADGLFGSGAGGGGGSGVSPTWGAGGKGGSGLLCLIEGSYYNNTSSYEFVILKPGATEFDVPLGVDSVDAFLLAGGGGGGSKSAGNFFTTGAGAAGGVLQLINHAVTPEETISLSVGTGGAQNNAGVNTTFDGQTALGGGRGGSGRVGIPSMDGGSGGGGNSTTFGNTPGLGTPGQGNDGGISTSAASGYKAGGGGGYSEVGRGGNDAILGGKGGNGFDFNDTIFFDALKFGLPGMCAGGGGAGIYRSTLTTIYDGGYAGLGGGGDGGSASVSNPNVNSGGSAAAGTGSGGGSGGGNNNTTGNASNGGAGSDGFIIVRYLRPGFGPDDSSGGSSGGISNPVSDPVSEPGPDPDPELPEGALLGEEYDELDPVFGIQLENGNYIELE